METNIELFDRYIDGELEAAEVQAFEKRLESDKSFADDFRIYLFTLKGICQEAEQDNLDFGTSMKNISKSELLEIIGHRPESHGFRLTRLGERVAWASAIAAILIVGMFTVLNVQKAGTYRLDDTIVAYNYIPSSDRGTSAPGHNLDAISEKDIPSLEEAYRNAPAGDLQAQEDAGMRLAMAYLKLHDRKKAEQTLTELSTRFADDEEFAAQCRRILDQLK